MLITTHKPTVAIRGYISKLSNRRGLGNCTIEKQTITRNNQRILLAPLHLHLAAGALLVFSISIVRLDIVAQVLEKLLGVGILNMIYSNEGLLANDSFQPLSILNWFFHAIFMVFPIEFAYSFYLLKKYHPDETARKKYSRFFVLFSIDIVQTFFTLISHSQIGYNPKLEQALIWWHHKMIMNNIFGTGLAVTFGSWILIPCFLAVLSGNLGFFNWPGRILATYTQVIYFGKEIPKMFACSMLLIPVLGATKRE